MEYPLAVVQRRLAKQALPGVLVRQGEVFTAPPKMSPVRYTKFDKILFGLFAALIIAIGSISVFGYVMPYQKLQNAEAEAKISIAVEDSLFEGSRLSPRLAALGIYDLSITRYADDTVVVSFPVTADVYDIIETISHVKGVFSFQCYAGTFYVTLLRGAV